MFHWHSEMPKYAFDLLLGLYLPIVILGSILNICLLAVILNTRKLRLDPRNSFILALAISDFFLCNFTSPLTLWYTLEGHWPFGRKTNIFCQLLKAGQNFPVIMSSFCIGAIACDRFRFIMQPHKKQMTPKQVNSHT
jgi:neuropeptide Y receptor